MLVNRFLSICYLLLIASHLLAQDEIFPVFKSGKWAVIDSSLKIKTPFDYDDIQIVNKNCFIAKQNGFYGFFDKDFNPVLPFKYKNIEAGLNKCLIINDGNYFGLSDFEGNLLLKCQYDSIKMPETNTAIVNKDSLWQYYHVNTKYLSPEYEQINYLDDEIYLLNKSGSLALFQASLNLTSPKYIQVEKKPNKLYFCSDGNNRKFIVYFANQFQIIPVDSFSYIDIIPGVFTFRNNNKIHIVDLYSNKQQEMEADEIFPPLKIQNNTMSGFITKAYYPFVKNGKYGLLDGDFKIILDAVFDEIKLSGVELLVIKDGKKGLYSSEGKMLVKPFYDGYTKSGMYWIIQNNSKFGLIDDKNNELIEPQYTGIVQLSANRFIVSIGNKSGMVNENNRIFIPIEYQSISNNANALILNKDNKYGLATFNGDFILKVNYERITKLNNQYFVFAENGKLGIIGADARIISKPQHSDVFSTPNENIFMISSLQMPSVSKKHLKEKFGLDINVPADDAVIKSYQTGIINSFGEILLEPAYYAEQISSDFEANMFYVKEDSSVIVISFESSGKLIEKTRYKNYIVVKNSNNQSDKNIWLQGGDDKLYGLFTRNGIKIIDYKYTTIRKNYFPNPDLVLTEYSAKKVGIVNDRTGKLMVPTAYRRIHTIDFKYSKLARCIKITGETILIDSMARVVEKGIGYLDNFFNKYTRVNKGGKIIKSSRKASLLPMVDTDSIHKILFDYEKPTFEICEGGKWGVMDTSGTWVIQPKYQFIQNYFNRVFIVQKDNKWGVINPADQQIIEFKFDEIRYFVDKLSKQWLNIPFYQVRQGKKWGVIDLSGGLVIKADYDEVEAIFIAGKTYLKTIIDNKQTMYGLINKEAQTVLNPQYLYVGQFCNGFARVKTANKSWQFINSELHKFPDNYFIDTHDFKYGMAAVKTKKGWGFINERGEMTIPDQYIEVDDFNGGYAAVKIRKKSILPALFKSKSQYLIIDKRGKITFNTKSKLCYNALNRQFVIKKAKKLAVINEKGKKVLPNKYLQVIESNDYGLYIVKDSKKQFGLFNSKGMLIVPFGKYKTYSGFSDGLCYVEGECLGYIDTLGNFRFAVQYEKTGDFNNGLAKIIHDKKWGYIDKQGKIAIPPIYNKAGDFNSGIAEVMDQNNNRKYINRNGKEQTPSNMESDGYLIISKDGYKGLADKFGRIIANPAAEDLSIFNQNYAPFGIKKQFGLFDAQGNIIADTKYFKISQVDGGLIKLENLEEIIFVK